MKDSRSVLAALVALGTLTALAGQRTTEAGVQYRLRWKSRVLRPVVGAMGTSAGAVTVPVGRRKTAANGSAASRTGPG
jgi:hypothetical protein